MENLTSEIQDCKVNKKYVVLNKQLLHLNKINNYIIINNKQRMQDNSEPIQKHINTLKNKADDFERELNVILSHTHVDKMEELNRKLIVDILLLYYNSYILYIYYIHSITYYIPIILNTYYIHIIYIIYIYYIYNIYILYTYYLYNIYNIYILFTCYIHIIRLIFIIKIVHPCKLI